MRACVDKSHSDWEAAVAVFVCRCGLDGGVLARCDSICFDGKGGKVDIEIETHRCARGESVSSTVYCV